MRALARTQRGHTSAGRVRSPGPIDFVPGVARERHDGIEAASLYRRGRQIMPTPDPWPLAGKERFERLVLSLAVTDLEVAPVRSTGATIRAEGRCGLMRDAVVFAGRTRLASQAFGGLVHRVLFGRMLIQLAAYERVAEEDGIELCSIPMGDPMRMRSIVTETANRLSCALPHPGPGGATMAASGIPAASFLVAQLEDQAPLDDGLLTGRCFEQWQALSRPPDQKKAMESLRSLVKTLD